MSEEKLEELALYDPSVASAEVIFEDVESLPTTYQHVLDREWGEPPKAFR